MTDLIPVGALVVAVVIGSLGYFAGAEAAAGLLPIRWRGQAKALAFIAPALLLVALVLIVPIVRTIGASFQEAAGQVGVDNYADLLRDRRTREAIGNNVAWLLVVPAATTAVGLLVAAVADRLRPRVEQLVKAVIFMPMVISLVGASTIWRFVYAWRPSTSPQVGLLNGFVVATGGEPIAWLSEPRINDLLLMMIMIWLQVGFAMVLFSAAIKNVPGETVEAARVDGAGDIQLFVRIVVPQVRGTIAVVVSTLVIFVLKVFDIVYATTNGNFGTDVIANRFIRELFTSGDMGRAAAIVVVLLVLTLPVMAYNVRRARSETTSS